MCAMPWRVRQKTLSILCWSMGSLSKIDVSFWKGSMEIVGAEEWVNGYEKGDDDSRVSLLGRKVDMNREVMDDRRRW